MAKKSSTKEYVYAEHTYNSRVFIQRFAHRKRFKFSMDLIRLEGQETCLDYGCGDGKLLLELSTNKNIDPQQLAGLEPYTETLENLQVKIFKDLESTMDHAKQIGGFDVITCFEVLEHFSPNGQMEQIRNFVALLRPEGRVIVSVPIEIFFPSLFKNLLRKVRYGAKEHNFRNIFSSFMGRPLLHLRQDNKYLSHMGFDHRALETAFRQHFDIVKKVFSPFPALGVNFNSQVFYELRLKKA